MTKKYNNKSTDYKDWTTQYLKKQAEMYHNILYGANACYGSGDILIFERIINELDRRGVSISTKLSFD